MEGQATTKMEPEMSTGDSAGLKSHSPPQQSSQNGGSAAGGGGGAPNSQQINAQNSLSFRRFATTFPPSLCVDVYPVPVLLTIPFPSCK